MCGWTRENDKFGGRLKEAGWIKKICLGLERTCGSMGPYKESISVEISSEAWEQHVENKYPYKIAQSPVFTVNWSIIQFFFN